MSVHEPAAQRASARTVGEAKIDQSHISARRVSECLIHRSNDTDDVVARLLHYAVQLDRDQQIIFDNQDSQPNLPNQLKNRPPGTADGVTKLFQERDPTATSSASTRLAGGSRLSSPETIAEM